MEDADWDELKNFILSKTDRSLGSKFLRMEIRHSFGQYKEKNWGLSTEGRDYNDHYKLIGNSLRRAFRVKFKSLPKKVNKQDIEGLAILWRLQAGK